MKCRLDLLRKGIPKFSHTEPTYFGASRFAPHVSNDQRGRLCGVGPRSALWVPALGRSVDSAWEQTKLEAMLRETLDAEHATAVLTGGIPQQFALAKHPVDVEFSENGVHAVLLE
jgi:hypothetical protein